MERFETRLDSQPALVWRWQQHNFRAMNTQVSTWLYSHTNAPVLADVERLFNSFEKRLSRFDPSSELSRLNASETEFFQASPTLLDALEVALLAAEATDGLYDPAGLTSLEKAGYDRSFEKMAQPNPLTPEEAGLISAVSPASTGPVYRPQSFRAIQLNRPRREIYKPAGLRLDLGGMGKGWAVDRAADRLAGLGPFLVNAGGDIFAYQSPPGQKGWTVDLVHPFQPDSCFAQVSLHHRALATSTLAKRRWQHQGQMMHHLIDPRTGQPAQTDALSVSVVTDRTVLAEIYAKVALILGAAQGLAYLRGLPGVEGLIYTADSRVLYTPGFDSILERLDLAGYLI